VLVTAIENCEPANPADARRQNLVRALVPERGSLTLLLLAIISAAAEPSEQMRPDFGPAQLRIWLGD
jgi:hypothetical protein